MKNKISLFVLAISLMFSVNSFASMCFEPVEGQSEESVQESKEGFEEAANLPMELATCGLELIKGMSPKKVFEDACPSGMMACAQVIKDACSQDKHGIWNLPLCIPFAPFM